jgi:hypothetical protein
MTEGPENQAAARGIAKFQHALSQPVLQEVEAWRGDPELGKLVERLDSALDPDPFRDTYAEVLVARRLLRHRCTLRVEVATPSGRTADLEATRGPVRVYVHVKRRNLDEATRRLYRIADCAAVLDHVPRDDVKFDAKLSGGEVANDEIQTFPGRLRAFGCSAAVGDTLSLPDAKPTVLRVTALPRGRAARPKLNREFPRCVAAQDGKALKKKLRDAYQQFMPNCVNLIAVTGTHLVDEASFAKALRGFWSPNQNHASVVAAFFRFSQDEDEFESRLWWRDARSVDQQTAQLVREVFDDQPAASQATVGE